MTKIFSNQNPSSVGQKVHIITPLGGADAVAVASRIFTRRISLLYAQHVLLSDLRLLGFTGCQLLMGHFMPGPFI